MINIPTVSVKIMQAKEIRFNLNGSFTCDNSIKNVNGNFTAKIDGNRIRLKNGQFEYLTEKETIFSPVSIEKDFFELKDVVIGIDFHWEQKENQQFQGQLKLIVLDNTICAINILDVETYLKSVISSEMRADSSPELLKAHAVVSRSWLFAQMEKQQKIEKSKYISSTISDDEFIRWYDREDHVLFDVCADDHCQRYQGITRAHNPNVVDAINATAGQVLMSENQVCDTRYSKCCGGASESFEKVWEPVNHPYLQKIIDNSSPSKFDIDLKLELNAIEWIKSKPDAFCNTTNKEVLNQVLNDYDQTSEHFYRWEISYEQKELAELIKRKSGFDFGEIIDLVPVERGLSSRLIKLKIVGTLKTIIVGKELEIRRWLSPSHLYSSAFVVTKENIIDGIPQKFIFTGAGWGHGVGLCQIGAAVMGHQGYTYEQILQHYFKGAALQRKY
jgi:SpoIID/LytB domain protein